MTKTPVFRGSCTALVTPFTPEGVDYERLGKNLEKQYACGSAAVLVCGTTGEAATLSGDEHNELVRFTVNTVHGRMKVIVGVGGNNTAAALKKAENARAAGADAILMVTPYYNKTTQRGLAAHFGYVAERVDIPMIVYNVPGRTGIGIQAETYRILADYANINGVKEASGNLALAGEIRSLCGDELNLYSGNDDNTVGFMALGGQGVISVLSNLLPAETAKLCSLCLEGEFPAAAALQARLLPLMKALFLETNPIPVKKAMQWLGEDSGLLRLPLVEMGEEAAARLRAAMREYGLDV